MGKHTQDKWVKKWFQDIKQEYKPTQTEVYDTVAYMSVPATLFLLPFAMFLGILWYDKIWTDAIPALYARYGLQLQFLRHQKFGY